MDLGWPQLTYIVLTLLGLGITMSRHGEAAPKYNFFMSLATAALVYFLLWSGGFFG